ncbi:protein kinase [Streptomyces sp. NPDC127098]|uniref:serine/threonine-protein kinase n=1 Tax=Streptomyces sp. NPDC127098 TaxID=3347137 RepID=UPI003657451D
MVQGDAVEGDAVEGNVVKGDEVFDRYELREKLGAGSDTAVEVWTAFDRVMARDVVLKRGRDERAIRRLKAASRAMAELKDHPHVAELYGTEESPVTGFWQVIEHVPGGSLELRLVSPEQAARWCAQIAAVLVRLHTVQLVHCDVKPSNVVLTAEENAKLIDFDSVCSLSGDGGTISFTPEFAAREVARYSAPCPRSDVFSLAATFHTLVAGTPPRLSHSPRSQAEQGRVVIDDRIPRRPRRMLAAMLAADPELRPDAAGARRVLERVAAGGRLPLGWRPDVRRRLLRTGAVAVLSALSGVLSLLLGGPWNEETARSPEPREDTAATSGSDPTPSAPPLPTPAASPSASVGSPPPSTVESPDPPELSRLDACFDGTCEVTVAEGTRIQLDGRYGVDEVLVTAVTPTSVNVSAWSDYGGGGGIGPAGQTLTVMAGFGVRVVSLGGDGTAVIALMPL